jgi:transcriptional regulator with XRE-family HTH domain
MNRFPRNEAVRALRKTIGLTQAEFSELIGVSKDAVVSWEIGRNEISETFARRVALVTGADWRTLRMGVEVPFSAAEDAHVYTKEDFERHQREEWGTEEVQARRLEYCRDALELLFAAAAQAGVEKNRRRLPGLVDSFMQWCEEAREGFKLGEQVDAQLEQRRFRAGITQEYGYWRALARVEPETLKAAGFEDDPSKGDKETLRLELDFVPGWAPGRSMKVPNPAVMNIKWPRGKAKAKG